jgi:hypothetical protein
MGDGLGLEKWKLEFPSVQSGTSHSAAIRPLTHQMENKSAPGTSS